MHGSLDSILPDLSHEHRINLLRHLSADQPRLIDFSKTLPIEITTRIFSFLPPKALVTLQTLSKNYNTLLKFPTIWRDKLVECGYFEEDVCASFSDENYSFYYDLYRARVEREKRWRTMSPVSLKQYKVFTDRITAIKINAKHAIFGSAERKLKLFKLPKSSENIQKNQYGEIDSYLLDAEVNVPSCVDLDVREGIVVAGSFSGHMTFCKFREGKMIEKLNHTSAVTCICIHKKMVYSGSHDSNIIAWDFQGNIIKIIQGHADKVSSLHSEARYLVSGSVDQTLRVWDTADDFTSISSSKYSDTVTNITCSHSEISFTSGNFIYMAKYISSYEEMPQVTTRYMNHHIIRGCKRGNKYIVTLSSDRIYEGMMKIHCSCSRTLKVMSDLVLPNSSVVCFDLDSNSICTGNNDGTITIINFV